MMTSPRIAGLITYQGEVLAGTTATWPAIISTEDRDSIIAILGDPAVAKRGRPPTYLLSGLLTCGVCGKPLRSGARSTGVRTWCCHRQPGEPDERCGGIAIRADHVDELVEAMIIDALSSRKFAQVTKRAAKSATTKSKRSTADEVSDLEDRITQLGVDHDDGLITRREWIDRRKRLQERLTAARATLTPDRNATVLGQFDAVSDVPKHWSRMTIDAQRAVARAVLDTVVINAATRGGDQFDKTRIDPRWRV